MILSNFMVVPKFEIPRRSPQAVHGVAFELPLAGAMLQ